MLDGALSEAIRVALLAAALTVPIPALDSAPASAGAWSAVSTPSPGTAQNTLFAVTTMPRGGVWAVGDRVSPPSARFIAPLVEHHHGSAWSASVLPGEQTNLLGAYSPARNNLWAVGFFQNGQLVQTVPVVSHHNGKGWRIITSPRPSSSVLSAIDGTSGRDIWATGRQFHHGQALTIVEHYNGKRWARVASPEPATDYLDLAAVVAIGRSDVWAAGDYHDAAGVSRTLVEHYDGHAWTLVPSPNVGAGDNYLSGLTVLGGRVWAVGRATEGTSSRAIALRWNGTRWTSQLLPRVGSGDASLNAVVAAPHRALWAVGNKTDSAGTQRTLTMRWHAGKWRVVPSPDVGSESNVLYGVTITPAHTLWAVGSATTKALSIRRQL